LKKVAHGGGPPAGRRKHERECVEFLEGGDPRSIFGDRGAGRHELVFDLVDDVAWERGCVVAS
jgi:hypothetical protein